MTRHTVYLDLCMVALDGLNTRDMGFEELRSHIVKRSPNASCTASKALTVIRQCLENQWIVKRGKMGGRGKYALTDTGKRFSKSSR